MFHKTETFRLFRVRCLLLEIILRIALIDMGVKKLNIINIIYYDTSKIYN